MSYYTRNIILVDYLVRIYSNINKCIINGLVSNITLSLRGFGGGKMDGKDSHRDRRSATEVAHILVLWGYYYFVSTVN